MNLSVGNQSGQYNETLPWEAKGTTKEGEGRKGALVLLDYDSLEPHSGQMGNNARVIFNGTNILSPAVHMGIFFGGPGCINSEIPALSFSLV